MNARIKALRAKYKAAGDFGTGEMVVWNSRTGPTQAEYRGKLYGMDGYEATIIVRPVGEPPFQITVPLSQLRKKSMDAQMLGKSMDSYRGWKIEKVEGATNVGYRDSVVNKTTHKISEPKRKISGYYAVDPYTGNQRWCDTLKEAKQYIDNYEG